MPQSLPRRHNPARIATCVVINAVHGIALAKGNPRAPVCSDCHTAHEVRAAAATSWQLSVIKECGTCHERCPMEALHAGDGATVVDLDRCIGCGACVPTCPSEAVRLRANARETVPPRDIKALYGRIAKERFGLLGTAKRIGRVLLGRQV